MVLDLFLIEKVAIDAEPGEMYFQWYADPVRNCQITYIYRIRAIDAADNTGAFAVPVEISCSIAPPPIPSISMFGMLLLTWSLGLAMKFFPIKKVKVTKRRT